jgi:hypothetical protein
VVVAVIITKRRWDGDPGLVEEVALWGFPAGLIGGRLYHLITSWNEVPHTWWGPFAVWKGGLGIWGGIALGVAVGLWRVTSADASVARCMDAGAPALLVAQSIGRVGNYFNQELFGKPTNLPWGLEISPEHRPEAYASSPTFHPTLRDHLEPQPRRVPGLARPPPAAPPPEPVRPLRRRLQRLPHLRGAHPRRPRALLLRLALEPVRRRDRNGRGTRLVRPASLTRLVPADAPMSS